MAAEVRSSDSTCMLVCNSRRCWLPARRYSKRVGLQLRLREMSIHFWPGVDDVDVDVQPPAAAAAFVIFLAIATCS